MNTLRLLLPGLLAVLAWGSGPLHATQPASPVLAPQIETFWLDNGLQVVVIPDRRSPVVTHMVWYRVGAADEPPGKSGIAHYLEHLMFKGTKDHPEGEFSKVIAKVGGQENAFTSADYTAYFQRVAKQHLRLMMEFEADRMANLVLTEENSKPELKVVQEERRSRIDNNPSAQLSQSVDAALYLQHPYGIPIIGWPHEIDALTYQDALDFYDTYYTPNNAILIVAGDVDTATVKDLALATYGKVKRRAEPGPRLRPREPSPLSQRLVQLESDQVKQPSLRLAWVVPSYSRAEPGEAESLDLLSEILGGGTTSRLYRKLVVEEKVATSAGSWFSSSGLDSARMVVYAVPRGDISLDELRRKVVKVIKDTIAEQFSNDEINRARNRLIAQTIYAQDSQSRLARMFGDALTTGSTIEDVQTWPQKLIAVKAAQIRDAGKKHLEIMRAVVGYLTAPKGDDDAS